MAGKNERVKLENEVGDIMNYFGMVKGNFDFYVASYPDTSTEVFTFKEGGSGGTTVGIITVTYTDDTKRFLNTVSLT